MAARVPLDVDLEDRIIFGLTPQRFGYLVLGALAAFALWGQHSWPEVVRAVLSTPPLAAAAAAAWGRWRGRRLDGYLLDAGRYLLANYEVRLTAPARPQRRQRLPEQPPPARDPIACCLSPGLDDVA